MKTFQLSGSARQDFGKKASKAVRKEDLIPAVMYGGEKHLSLSVSQEGVRKLIYTPEVFIIDLEIDGKVHKAILKDLQFHPVTDEIIHIDFLEVNDQKPIVMEVPVELVGHAEGVRAGGKLILTMRKVKVKALYTAMPEKLKVDVSNVGLGKSIQIGDLHFEGLELMNAKNNVVCSVKLTRAARGAAAKSQD